MRKIGIIDVGYGNVSSIANYFSNDESYKVETITDCGQIYSCDLIVLAGVGTFGNAMQKINETLFLKTIKEYHQKNGKILGICLGLQLFYEHSEETLGVTGLGLLQGQVVRNHEDNSTIGWSTLESVDNHIPHRYFFSHTYHVQPFDVSTVFAIARETKYPAIIRKNNILGFQFHPEKSQTGGKFLLSNTIKNFLLGQL